VLEPQRCRRQLAGSTLIELLVVIAIIAILAAIMFPVFAMARDRARGTSCLSNMRQLGNALMMYCSDKGGRFPPYIVGEYAAAHQGVPTWDAIQRVPGRAPATVPGELFAIGSEFLNCNMDLDAGCSPSKEPPAHFKTWMDCLFPYTKNLQVFMCPSHNNNIIDLEKEAWYASSGLGPEYYWVDNNKYVTPSIGTNSMVFRQSFAPPGEDYKTFLSATEADFKDASSKVVFLHLKQKINSVLPNYTYSQSLDSYNQPDQKRAQWNRWPHNDGSTMVFADGHVKWLSRRSMAQWTCSVPNTTAASYNGIAMNATTRGRVACGYWTPEVAAPTT